MKLLSHNRKIAAACGKAKVLTNPGSYLTQRIVSCCFFRGCRRLRSATWRSGNDRRPLSSESSASSTSSTASARAAVGGACGGGEDVEDVEDAGDSEECAAGGTLGKAFSLELLAGFAWGAGPRLRWDAPLA